MLLTFITQSKRSLNIYSSRCTVWYNILQNCGVCRGKRFETSFLFSFSFSPSLRAAFLNELTKSSYGLLQNHQKNSYNSPAPQATLKALTLNMRRCSTRVMPFTAASAIMAPVPSDESQNEMEYGHTLGKFRITFPNRKNSLVVIIQSEYSKKRNHQGFVALYSKH